MATLAPEIEPAAFDTAAAARYSGIPQKTLEYLRHKRKGPDWILVPGTGAVRYRRVDLDAYLAQGVVSAADGPSAEQKLHQRRGGPGRKPKSAKLRNRMRA